MKNSPQNQIRKFGGKVGNNVFIGSGVLIDYDLAFLLEIGDGVVVASNSIIELHDSSLPNVLVSWSSLTVQFFDKFKFIVLSTPG